MARHCTVCGHPKRRKIEAAHLEGQSLSAIAREHDLSRDSIRRHVEAHLSDRMAKAAEKKEIAAGTDLLDQLLELNKICRAVLADAYKAGERDTALRAVARLEKQFELRARLLGEIRDNQISVVNLEVTASEAERIARIFLQSPPPAYIETKLAEESYEPDQ